MMLIARRWPILAGLLAGGYFFLQNFTIDGLENIQVKSRSPQASTQSSGSATTGPTATSQLPMQLPSGMPSTLGFSEGWRENLSLGEKLAVWEAQCENKNSAAKEDMSALPIAPLVPVPPGFPSFGSETADLSILGAQLPSTAPTTSSLSNPGIDSLGRSSPHTSTRHGFNDIGQSDPSSIPPGNMIGLSRNTQAFTQSPHLTENLIQPQASAPAADGFRRGAKSADDDNLQLNGIRSIRIASFNTDALGSAKLSKPHVLNSLVQICSQFDVIALQEIQSSRDDLLPIIVEQLNLAGRHFDYVIGPRVGRGAKRLQYAIVFDTTRLETDRYQLYTVDDPDDLVAYEPLVAWFRCKEPAVEEAFTFSLINLRIHPNLAQEEWPIIPDLIEVIKQDGREEDDWIIAGDIAGSPHQLTSLGSRPVRFAILDTPTDVAGMRSTETIFFSGKATMEYTGKSGVFDFLRKYNLSFEEAQEISGHLPVWAEFSTIEGAQPGRIAPVSEQSVF